MSSLPNPHSRRRAIRMVITLILLAGVGGAASWWYLEVGQWVESTDNAYIQGNIVTIASKVAGEVIYLAAEENDHVEAGTVMVRLSYGDAQRGLNEAKHVLGFSVREVMTRRARVDTARSELKLKQTTHELAKQEFERRAKLVERKMVSQEELDAARTRAEETAVELQTARSELAEAEVEAGSGPVQDHPIIKVASAHYHDAYRTLNKHVQYTKVPGRVAQRMVQIGTVVAAGAPLYSIVEDNNFWVEANFKENQLMHIRPGQPVTIKADTYGDEHVFKGVVSSIGTGTGATFSVLPPQNATGNWIKIVQRVPVRIDFDGPPDPDFPLVIGASLEVKVDTHNRSEQRPLSRGNIGRISTEAEFEDLNAGVEEAIETIIAENILSINGE